jgi:hypothetical protein
MHVNVAAAKAAMQQLRSDIPEQHCWWCGIPPLSSLSTWHAVVSCSVLCMCGLRGAVVVWACFQARADNHNSAQRTLSQQPLRRPKCAHTSTTLLSTHIHSTLRSTAAVLHEATACCKFQFQPVTAIHSSSAAACCCYLFNSSPYTIKECQHAYT